MSEHSGNRPRRPKRPAGGSNRGSRRTGDGRSSESRGRGKGSERRTGAPRGSDRGRGGKDGQAGGKPRRDDRRGDGGAPRKGPQRQGSQRQGSQRQGKPSERQREQLRVAGAGADLPNWIKEEVARVTPREKRNTVLNLLGEGADAFAEGRYPRAHQLLTRAKKEASRVATVRELLGLTAYRMSRWEEALRELRTYRRIDGDTTHMPVEADAQRALGRDHDVEKTYERYLELGGRKSTDAEMKVVFGSYLLDKGRARDAWRVVNPGRIHSDAKDWDLRQWYVAARVAAELGDMDTARQLAKAIEDHDPAFPGLDELHAAID